MTRRERESLTEFDPHDALFGEEVDRDSRSYRPTRADRRRLEREHGHARRSRRGWLITLFTLALVAAVAVLVVPRVIDYFHTDDYAGAGTGNRTVEITVHSGDSASDIANTLVDAGVVESSGAFTDAADADTKSTSIQPGVYELHTKQSGKSALAALLDPATRLKTNEVVVPEGANIFAVEDGLVKVLGSDQRDAIRAALAKPEDLALPIGYGTPTTAEGFLYPATYTIDPGTSAREALTTMVLRFIQADRGSGFAAEAKVQGLDPYEALTVASIVQAEAKFADDMPKVAEVIYNRLKASTRLQIDATTLYGCELKDEKNCVYNNFPSPYNSYTNDGLPPSPIDNPGAQAMDAAVHPDTGKLLFYVNGDADGHLAFSTNEKDFAVDRDKCAANNWGCAP